MTVLTPGNSKDDTDKSKTGAPKTIFEGNPLRCRVSFARGLTSSVPTTVTPRTNLVKGDLFVINLNEDKTERVLMEVDRVEEERPIPAMHPEIIIDDILRKTFTGISVMTSYYTMQKVANKEIFALYLVELQVKEQYFSRGDMWRFSRKLVNTTVYLKKSLDILGMRATVYGLWVPESPYRVSSGYITKDTKIVYRSLSACCTIFLQMAKEMWDFDHHGDIYYEKAVDGFLHDLFTRWKTMSCQHDVTMTLFSRVFYDAKSIENFPRCLRQDINQDNRGRFYEDFYRVIYQNERYDDWLPRLAKIKQVIVNYKDDLENYHRRHLPAGKGNTMPRGTISCAADGNFLETLNLSSSVFERHYIDRAFDRLGQMSLVITPGAGVFEVDRELTIMTKQRVLDNGIGSDLVCLGEQPLFAVPLFRFFKGDVNTADDYQIPHWMNLSYYRSSTAPSCFKRYIPRLPFDTGRIKNGMLEVKNVMNSIEENTFTKPPHLSMEEYDNQVFRTTKNSNEKKSTLQRPVKGESRVGRKRYITTGSAKHTITEEEETAEEPNGMLIVNNKVATSASIYDDPRHFNANVKDDIGLSTSHATSAMTLGHHFHNTFQSSQVLFYNSMSLTRGAQSANTYFLASNVFSRLQARPKALTNPFAPASIRIPMVPGRRRWAHTFPIGPNKIPWHFHHLRKMEGAIKREMLLTVSSCANLVLPSTSKCLSHDLVAKKVPYHSKMHSDSISRPKRLVSPSNFGVRREFSERKDSTTTDENRTINNNVNIKKPTNDNSSVKPPALKKEKKEAIIWGPTGVEPWSASMITGIDWKSLTIPASLPTTFDVEPTEDDLKRDYTHNSYELIHILPPITENERRRRLTHTGSGNSERSCTDPSERQKLLFDELIDQRLSQGFQMITEIPGHIRKMMVDRITRIGYKETEYNRLLSVGRIYHTLSLVTDGNQTQDAVVVCLQQFKPQYIFQPKAVDYKYRFQCPDSSCYDPANYELKLESLESFPWNIVDNAVCNHGTGDHQLSDTMKYWRARLALMPILKDYTIKNIESGQRKCDSREEMSREDYFLYVEHFVRFLIMLNKLIRVRVVGYDCFHRPIDPITGLKRNDHPRRSGRHTITCKTFQLGGIMSEDKTAINNLLILLRDEQQGLPFVKDLALPEYSFIAAEAVWWAIEHCDDIQNEEMSLSLFQYLFQNKYIKHCTYTDESFRFGFFLYYIVTEKTEHFHLDSNDYAEVEFHQTQHFIPSMDYLGFGLCQPMRLLPTQVNQPLPAMPPVRLGTSSSNVPKILYADNVASAESITQPVKSMSNTLINPVVVNGTPKDKSPSTTEVPSITLQRVCNVDVDPKQISDRREWASAQYHAHYNPHCLFELEIRWLVATSCILGELITNWSQRTGTTLGTNQVSFHLVPIPCDPFAEFDPLRGNHKFKDIFGPIYIKMDISCLRDQLSTVDEPDRSTKMNIFQELILKRYGFILSNCVTYTGENIYYVHISGGMLVYIISNVYNKHCGNRPKRIASSRTIDSDQMSPVDFGFFWCWNFCLGKRWRSSQTGEEKYQDIMLADFTAFCENHEGRLLNFWNEVTGLANAQMAERNAN